MTFTELLQYLNLGLIPVLFYVIKIEIRLAKGDEILTEIKKHCPVFNMGVCPRSSTFMVKGLKENGT